MAVFEGPAMQSLSLNPQEDAQFQKEVAHVRQRATQVSMRRGPSLRGLPDRAVPGRAPLTLPMASHSARPTESGSLKAKVSHTRRFMLVGKLEFGA